MEAHSAPADPGQPRPEQLQAQRMYSAADTTASTAYGYVAQSQLPGVTQQPGATDLVSTGIPGHVQNLDGYDKMQVDMRGSPFGGGSQVPGNRVSAPPILSQDVSAAPIPRQDVSTVYTPNQDVSTAHIPSQDVSAAHIPSQDGAAITQSPDTSGEPAANGAIPTVTADDVDTRAGSSESSAATPTAVSDLAAVSHSSSLSSGKETASQTAPQTALQTAPPNVCEFPPLPRCMTAQAAEIAVTPARIQTMFKSLIHVDATYVARNFISAVSNVDKSEWGTAEPDPIESSLQVAISNSTPQFWNVFKDESIDYRPLIARVRNWMAHMIKLKQRQRVGCGIKALSLLPMTENEFLQAKLFPVLRILQKTQDSVGSLAAALATKFNVPKVAPEPAPETKPVLSSIQKLAHATSNTTTMRAKGPKPPVAEQAGAIAQRPITPGAPQLGPNPAQTSSASRPPAQPRIEKRQPVSGRLPPARKELPNTQTSAPAKKISPVSSYSIGALKAQIGKRPRPQPLKDEVGKEEDVTKKPKKAKSVRWKPDPDLVTIRYFESNNDKSRLKSSKSAKAIDAAEGAVAKKSVTAIEWTHPRPIDFSGLDVDERILASMGCKRGGKMEPNSLEKQTQQAREATVLMAVYSPENTPDTPKEAPVEQVTGPPPVVMKQIVKKTKPQQPAATSQPLPFSATQPGHVGMPAPMAGQMYMPQFYPFMGAPSIPGMPVPGMPMPGMSMPGMSTLGMTIPGHYGASSNSSKK